MFWGNNDQLQVSNFIDNLKTIQYFIGIIEKCIGTNYIFNKNYASYCKNRVLKRPPTIPFRNQENTFP
jgi:hypothetical protein